MPGAVPIISLPFVYLVRERRHFWHSMPSIWMIGASVLDISIVSMLATKGVLMAPISPSLVLLVGRSILLL